MSEYEHHKSKLLYVNILSTDYIWINFHDAKVIDFE